VSLWNVKRVGEPASDEYVTDAKYPEHLKKAVEENVFCSKSLTLMRQAYFRRRYQCVDSC